MTSAYSSLHGSGEIRFVILSDSHSLVNGGCARDDGRIADANCREFATLLNSSVAFFSRLFKERRRYEVFTRVESAAQCHSSMATRARTANGRRNSSRICVSLFRIPIDGSNVVGSSRQRSGSEMRHQFQIRQRRRVHRQGVRCQVLFHFLSLHGEPRFLDLTQR